MKTILSIDPSGDERGHTGIALLGYDDTTPAHLLASWAVPGGIEQFRDWWKGQFPQWVHRPTLQYAPGCGEVWVNTVIVEHFVNRAIRGADISPLGMEYIVRWLWPDAVLSPASGKNTAIPDSAMYAAGFEKTMFPGDHHADRWEALRHGLVWLKNKERHLPTLLKLFPK